MVGTKICPFLTNKPQIVHPHGLATAWLCGMGWAVYVSDSQVMLLFKREGHLPISRHSRYRDLRSWAFLVIQDTAPVVGYHDSAMVIFEDPSADQQVSRGLKKVVQINPSPGRHVEQALDTYLALNGPGRSGF